MHHHRPSVGLPVEVLSIIFDVLQLQHLLTSSHISTFWRAAALRHKTYWRDITLAAVSTTAKEFFQARLAVGGQRTIHLRVLKSESPISHMPTELVLPVIQRNLFRMATLIFVVDIAYEHEVFAALRNPAPQLHTLDLAMVHRDDSDDCSWDGIPADLFASRAPSLRHVRLENILLHADRLPVAFSTLTVLKCDYSERALFPIAAILAHAKSLHTLDLHAEALSLVQTDSDEAEFPTHVLRSVQLAVMSGACDLVQRLPCASIRALTVSLVDKQSSLLMLDQLRGRLEARLHHTESAYYLEYRSLDTGMTRSFIASHRQIASAYLPPVFLNGFTARIQALNSSATATGLIPVFREVPSCTRFTLSLADGEAFQPPERPISVTELQDVVWTSSLRARLRSV